MCDCLTRIHLTELIKIASCKPMLAESSSHFRCNLFTWCDNPPFQTWQCSISLLRACL